MTTGVFKSALLRPCIRMLRDEVRSFSEANGPLSGRCGLDGRALVATAPECRRWAASQALGCAASLRIYHLQKWRESRVGPPAERQRQIRAGLPPAVCLQERPLFLKSWPSHTLKSSTESRTARVRPSEWASRGSSKPAPCWGALLTSIHCTRIQPRQETHCHGLSGRGRNGVPLRSNPARFAATRHPE